MKSGNGPSSSVFKTLKQARSIKKSIEDAAVSSSAAEAKEKHSLSAAVNRDATEPFPPLADISIRTRITTKDDFDNTTQPLAREISIVSDRLDAAMSEILRKQDVIDDLSAIRENASLAPDALTKALSAGDEALAAHDAAEFAQHQIDSLARVATTGSYHDLDDIPEIPPSVTGVAGNFAGFDANGNLADTGKSPNDFAPAGDYVLAAEVEAVDAKANTAFQTARTAYDALSAKADVGEVEAIDAKASLAFSIAEAAKNALSTKADVREVEAVDTKANLAFYTSESVRNALSAKADVTAVEAVNTKADLAFQTAEDIQQQISGLSGDIPYSVRQITVDSSYSSSNPYNCNTREIVGITVPDGISENFIAIGVPRRDPGKATDFYVTLQNRTNHQIELTIAVPSWVERGNWRTWDVIFDFDAAAVDAGNDAYFHFIETGTMSPTFGSRYQILVERIGYNISKLRNNLSALSESVGTLSGNVSTLSTEISSAREQINVVASDIPYKIVPIAYGQEAPLGNRTINRFSTVSDFSFTLPGPIVSPDRRTVYAIDLIVDVKNLNQSPDGIITFTPILGKDDLDQGVFEFAIDEGESFDDLMKIPANTMARFYFKQTGFFNDGLDVIHVSRKIITPAVSNRSRDLTFLPNRSYAIASNTNKSLSVLNQSGPMTVSLSAYDADEAL